MDKEREGVENKAQGTSGAGEEPTNQSGGESQNETNSKGTEGDGKAGSESDSETTDEPRNPPISGIEREARAGDRQVRGDTVE